MEETSISRSTWCSHPIRRIAIEDRNEQWQENDRNDSIMIREKATKTNLISMKEDSLNEEFRNCFNYAKLSQRKIEKKLEVNVSCKVMSLHQGHSQGCNNLAVSWDNATTCSLNITQDLVLLKITRRENLQPKENITIPELNLTNSDITMSLMCYMDEKRHDIREKLKYPRNAKYLFVQPIVIKFPSNYVDPDQINLISTPTIVMIIIAIPFFIVMLGLFVKYYKRKILSTQTKMTEMQELNTENSYESEESTRPFLESFRGSNGGDQNFVDPHHEDCSDCQIIATLPKPLLDAPDMLYPRSSLDIEKDIELGHGNFGSVFKGNLTIGKARSVLYHI